MFYKKNHFLVFFLFLILAFTLFHYFLGNSFYVREAQSGQRVISEDEYGSKIFSYDGSVEDPAVPVGDASVPVGEAQSGKNVTTSSEEGDLYSYDVPVGDVKRDLSTKDYVQKKGKRRTVGSRKKSLASAPTENLVNATAGPPFDTNVEYESSKMPVGDGYGSVPLSKNNSKRYEKIAILPDRRGSIGPDTLLYDSEDLIEKAVDTEVAAENLKKRLEKALVKDVGKEDFTTNSLKSGDLEFQYMMDKPRVR